MSAAQLPLRDVHLPPAPGWWPPAPGWWLLAVVVLLASLAMAWWLWHRRRRRRQWRALFAAAAASGSPTTRLAAISALLRRAGRRLDPGADTLRGEAWLRFLDGRKGKDFSAGAGRLLLDGGFRREVAEAEYRAACELALARFLELMAGRK